MTLSLVEINTYLGSFFWPFVRIGTALGVAPIFGARTVPMRIRLGLAVVLTWVILPVIPPVPAVSPFAPQGVILVANQMLLGFAIGFTLLMIFAAFIIGGQVIAMQMGLGFASLVDPQNGVQTPVVSQLYVLMTTLVFLTLDGHLVMVSVIAESFVKLPIAVHGLTPIDFWQVAEWGKHIFQFGVQLALPAITTLLLVNISFGVMTRAAPQMNIFAVGFPVIMTAGFTVILFTIPTAYEHLRRALQQGFELMRALLL